MAECNIGALLVMDRGTLVGIVTERDIVKNAARDKVQSKDVIIKTS
jgi:CBS domain-containing protein